jgi:precorrin-2/cobalt-factor-2 C20-methyltransferase
MTRLAPRYPVTVVPGVSSMTACAAAAGLPLAQRDEALSVIPATLDEAALTRQLAEAEAAAVIKLGRHFAKLRRVAERLGMLEGGVYVEHASLPDQRILPLVEVDPAEVPYFAMALLRRKAQP